MKNRIKRLLTLIVSVAMVMCVFTACDGKTTESGTNTTKPGGGKGNTKADINPNVNEEEYRGTSITYVTWKDPANNEDGIVVDAFEEKYGITVNIDLISQVDYVNTIASSIASGTQGDVIFVNSTFPGALTVMQPLDAAKLYLEDPIWKQSTLKMSSIDGHPYLVDTISNVWSEVDIVVYNKALFEQNGITSPAEYYEAGNWTLETFKKACQDIVALGKGYTGATVLGDALLGGCGVSTHTYENGQFNTNLNDKYYKVTEFLAQMFSDGLISDVRTKFTNGKTGMAVTNCFGLKRTGYFSTMNSDYIAATYLPRYDRNSEQVTTGIYRGWGLIRGAKNPVAAGLFLREYLDVNNYDLDATFHNQDAANFFFKVTGEDTNILYYYTYGLSMATGQTEMSEFELTSFKRTPDQVKGYLDSQLPTLKNMAEKGNAIIKSQIAIAS